MCSSLYCRLTLRQTLRYIRPPESLITQLDVYTEEKFEDEEDMRERAFNLFQTGDRHNTSELASTVEELVALTRSRTEEYDKIVKVLKALIPLFQQRSEKYDSQQLSDNFNHHSPSFLATNLSSVIVTFIEQASSIDDLCDSALQSLAAADIN